jgi:hypothetical protein
MEHCGDECGNKHQEGRNSETWVERSRHAEENEKYRLQTERQSRTANLCGRNGESRDTEGKENKVK